MTARQVARELDSGQPENYNMTAILHLLDSFRIL